MGRLKLTALRMRRRAVADFDTGRTQHRPVWLDVAMDIPPAQIFTRQQPLQHPLTQIRTKTVLPLRDSDPDLPPQTVTETTVSKPSRLRKKASRHYQPLPIRYEEDELRKQFYSDHPWELARPRVVLETDGDNTSRRDYSRNVRSPNAALNGESVVQRQLYLLQNVPDISGVQAYDIARREFYRHRLREDIERRVAVEEAQAVGANFGKTLNHRSVEIEDRMVQDWEDWSRHTVMENMQRSAAFAGQQVADPTETEGTGDDVEQEPSEAIGAKVFAKQPSR